MRGVVGLRPRARQNGRLLQRFLQRFRQVVVGDLQVVLRRDGLRVFNPLVVHVLRRLRKSEGLCKQASPSSGKRFQQYEDPFGLLVSRRATLWRPPAKHSPASFFAEDIGGHVDQGTIRSRGRGG